MRRILSGRRDECARIDEVVDRVEGGRSATLILRGDPGIGKTALLSYAAERATAFRTLRATGAPDEADLAFAGLHELLRPVLDLLPTIPPVQARALGVVLGVEDGPPAGAMHLGAAVLSLLSAAAEERPVLCLIDDAEQLDPPSAQAISFAARRLEAERVGMIWASADDRVAPWMPALAISGLSIDDAVALTIERSDRPVVPAVARAVAEAAAGNPLACVVVPQALSDRQLAGAEPLPHPLPVAQGLSAAYMARTSNLSPEARTALIAAAASDTATMRVLAPATEEDEGSLTELEMRGLLVIEEGRYAFAQPLMRSAIYHQATPAERRAAHLEIAERLEGDDRYRVHRAWHRSAASPGPDDRVARDLEEAARHAVSPATATLLFERAARYAVEDDHRSASMLEAAEAAGQSARAVALATAALAVDRDPVRRVRLGLVSSRASDAPERGTEDGLLRDADAIAAIEPELAGRAIGEIALRRADGDLARRARDLGAHDVGARVIIELAIARAEADPGAAFAALRSASDLALAPSADPDGNLRLHVADVAAELGIEPVLEDVFDAGEIGTMSSQRIPRWLARRAFLQQLRGAWRDAEIDLDDAARRLEGAGRGRSSSVVIAHMSLLDAWRGRAVDERLADLAGDASIPEAALAAVRDRVEGVSALTAGDARAAASRLRTWHASPERSAILAASATDAVDLVEALARAGEDAEPVMDAILDRDDDDRAARAWATGLLAAQGEDSLSEALAHFEARPRPFVTARIRLHLAEAIRRGGERVRARDHLRAAIATFDALGAVPWGERARRELRASGEHIARYDASRMDELTPQELQVARLIADGATYKEAAAALFLSPKTIEFHLGKVYRKLGIASRGELAAQMHRMELAER